MLALEEKAIDLFHKAKQQIKTTRFYSETEDATLYELLNQDFIDETVLEEAWLRMLYEINAILEEWNDGCTNYPYIIHMHFLYTKPKHNDVFMEYLKDRIMFKTVANLASFDEEDNRWSINVTFNLLSHSK